MNEPNKLSCLICAANCKTDDLKATDFWSNRSCQPIMTKQSNPIFNFCDNLENRRKNELEHGGGVLLRHRDLRDVGPELPPGGLLRGGSILWGGGRLHLHDGVSVRDPGQHPGRPHLLEAGTEEQLHLATPRSGGVWPLVPRPLCYREYQEELSASNRHWWLRN